MLAFDKVLVAVRKKAIRCYRDAHRSRAVATQQFHVADLHLYLSPPLLASRCAEPRCSLRDRREPCVKILRKVLKSHASSTALPLAAPVPAAPAAFGALLAALHARLASCLRASLPDSVRDYVASLLAFARHAPDSPAIAFVLSELHRLSPETVAPESDDAESPSLELGKVYVDALTCVARVEVARDSLVRACALDERVAFRVRVVAQLRGLEDVIGAFDELTAQFVLEDDVPRAPALVPRTLLCSARDVRLGPTPHTLTLLGDALVAGTYALDRVWLRLGRLVFVAAVAHPSDADPAAGVDGSGGVPRVVVRASVPSARVDVLVSGVLVRGATQHLVVHGTRLVRSRVGTAHLRCSAQPQRRRA